MGWPVLVRVLGIQGPGVLTNVTVMGRPEDGPLHYKESKLDRGPATCESKLRRSSFLCVPSSERKGKPPPLFHPLRFVDVSPPTRSP